LPSRTGFGAATAILAGEALRTLAFRLGADNAARLADPRAVARVVADVADAAGTDGMVGGQVIDIESEGKDVGADTLEYIHRHKRSEEHTSELQSRVDLV